MKKQLQKSLSLLLMLVMLLGMLPAPAQAATTYTKAGEIGAVTAECAPIAAPTLGGEVISHFQVTVTSPTDKGLSNPTGDEVQWQSKTGDTWMDYTEDAFDEGTYRLCIRLTSIARSNGNYYALVPTTTLTVNGTPFMPGEAPSDSTYQTRGNASMGFYSQEYTVTKEAGTYLVTVTAGANGRASADKVYGKTGEVVTLTAEPYTGYRLKEWRVLSGGVTVENNQFTIGSEDVEIRAIFESTNEKLGDLTRVEVTKKEGVDYRPIMGSTAGRIDVTIRSSTPDDDTLSVGGYGCGIWEVKQPDGRWAHFSNEPFTYGTYRMRISLRNEVEDGKYHALTKNTALVVDGEEWAADPDSLYTYYSLADGYGMMSFVSEEMDVIPVLDVYDGTPVGCHVVPVLGEFTVPLGDLFSFTIEPDDHYELTNPEALEVEVNEEIVTPDANGVYTVPTENTDGVSIYTGGNAFTGYSNLIISANSKTVTEKVYVGDSYTFKTLAEFGATVPENSTFTGWKIGGKIYQPGDTYTVVGTTDIKVNAAFTGLYNVTVENGKAYADEAHTIPISAAAENQVIYIVADPAPEGKVFSYWNRTFAVVGGHGWFGDSESAETTFTVYDSDVVLAPVYESLVDEIVINGMAKPSAGVAIDNSDYSYKWGCSVPADSGYTLGISYWYDITEGEPEFAMSSGDVFRIGHTYRFKARIHLKADHIYPANPEDIAVSLDGIAPEDYTYTIYEIGYTSATIYFEFTCPREKPDTSYVRPEGRGTVVQPFRIGTVGELYWFAGFVNGTITADDISMSVNEVHAILINDITVNPDLLTKDYALNAGEEDTALLAAWEPLEPANGYLYMGTFDGQGHTISGIYCAPQPDGQYYGFFTSLSADFTASGCIRDLTLADSYFCAPARNTAYTGVFAGRLASGSTVENCHFDGTVTTAITADSADKGNYEAVRIAGIAGFVSGEIRDCTARGLISGYSKETGGIAAGVHGGKVIGCVNEATVESTRSSGYYYPAGIVGRLYNGIIQDCCNKGDVIAVNGPAGIVSYVEDAASSVIRCWNEGNIEGNYGAGIAGELSGTVQNCYNTGSAAYAGIAGTPYNGSSVTYCHNVGTITDGSAKSIIGYTRNSCTVANCYYLADSESDSVDGTTHKNADQFADGTVLALLNADDNAGNWKQDAKYPVLNGLYTLTVNGGTGSGEYGEGASVTVAAEVPDGYVFAGWKGLEGLSGEDGQPARDTAATTFLMPGRDVELTAQFVSTTPVRPANGDGTPENPFEITTLAELLWFQGYVNYEIEDPALYIVQPFKSCAKLMNDITVNHALLNDEGGTRGGAKLEWKPISKEYSYRGTFDGQGYSISGLYHDVGVNSTTVNMETCYLGLFGILGNGGVIRDLTVKDSYLGAPYDQFDACTGGIVASIDEGGTVENCHFNGIVTAPNEDNSTYRLGGIAAVNGGDIRNCTSKGLITGYFTYGGGVAGSMVQGTVTYCVNEATVENLVPLTGRDSNCSGGIVGTMATGTVRNCCNKGDVSGNNSGGIVGGAGWAYREGAAILRCWNEGTVENGAGIAETISGDNVTIKNCYNAGSVRYGIASSYTGSGHSVTYCHNVGELTAGFSHGAPIIPAFDSDSDIVVANCYYMADSELDEVDGTTYKTAVQFADGTVLALLNNGHWTQGEDDAYPVLGNPPTSISGSITIDGTSATASVTVEELSGKAILIIAQYSGGQMKAVQIVSVTADVTFAPDDPFTHADGCAYKAFLLDADTYVPLCPEAELGGI